MFPLLHLDRLSFDEVLRNLTPIELFNLSLCSKISLLNVKKLIRRTDRNCFLLLSIATNCSVNVYDKKSNECKIKSSFVVHGTEQLRFQNANQAKGVINGIQFTGVIFENGSKLKTYWENEDLGFKALIEHIEDLYGNGADLYFNGNNTRKLFRMIEWTKNRPKPVNYANINLKSINNGNEISNILDALKFCEELQLNMNPGEDFIKNDHRTYKFKYVSFSGGNWFNLQRLLSMECPNIKVYNTSLTNSDINLFLRQWVKEIHQEFKYLALAVKDLNVPLILSDIPHSQAGPATFMNVKASAAFHIRRYDKKIARIFELPPDLAIKKKNLNFIMYV